MVADWQKQLAGVTDEQVVNGLNQLPLDWPPTASSFRLLCFGRAAHWQQNTAAYRDSSRPKYLEVKPDPAKAGAALRKAKALLGGQLDARERARLLDDAQRTLLGGD